MIYKISNGILEIFTDSNDATPHLSQPSWPNGDVWESGEAEAWAEQYILAMGDPSADLPGPNKKNPVVSRPSQEELDAHLADQPVEGMTKEQLEVVIQNRVAEALAAQK